MPVAIQSFVASQPDTADALADIDRQLTARPGRADLIFAFYSVEYDDALLHRFLVERFPGVPLIGGSSGSGVMSQSGLGAVSSIGLLLVDDPDGAYGVVSVPLAPHAQADRAAPAQADRAAPAHADRAAPAQADAATIAERALHEALRLADAAGELPDLVWIYQHPGREEEVVAGLRRVVGDRCPIVGGSSASGSETAAWRQLGPDGATQDALIVGVLFPSGGLAVAFQGGFQPIGQSGIVTKVGSALTEPHGGAVVTDGYSDMYDAALDPGRSPTAEPSAAGPSSPGPGSPGQGRISRHILEIDGEPAGAVYDRWTEGRLPADAMEHGGSVAVPAVWGPLGVASAAAGDLTYFRAVHVDRIGPERGLHTYAGVAEGTRVYGMRGNRSSLISRAGRVAASAVSALRGEGAEPAGAVMIYCVGCRLAVGDDIAEVAESAREGFADLPFVGCFTAGEQGPAMGENVHANLMISAVVFGR